MKIKENVPFFSPFLNAHICIGNNPPENFSGYRMSVKSLGFFRDMVKTTAYVFAGSEIIGQEGIGYPKAKPTDKALSVKLVFELTDKVLIPYGLEKNYAMLQRKINIDLMILSLEEITDLDTKKKIFSNEKSANNAIPYMTFFNKKKTDSEGASEENEKVWELNKDLFDLELGMLNPKKIVVYESESDLKKDLLDTLKENFNVVFKK